MGFFAALQALAASGAFAARAFLPAFLVALVARFPGLLNWAPFVPERPVTLSPGLAWLSSDWCLVTLGLLAVLESLATRSSDVREVWREVEPVVKGVLATLVAFAILDPESRAVLQHFAAAPPAAGILLDGWRASALLFALFVGLVAYGLARVRASLLMQLHEMDDGGHLGLGRLLAWVEDAWAGCGTLLALVAPVLALLAAAAILGLTALVTREVERRADERRLPCAACGHRLFPEARACPSCRVAREPSGEPTSSWWPDRWWDARPLGGRRAGLELLAKGRCPACAETREPKDLLACAPHGCGWPATSEALDVPGPGWPSELDAHVTARFHRLLLPVTALGLFPIAGAVGALVLGRLRLVAPLRRYLPVGSRFLSRWQARALVLLLLLPSGFPILSALAAPLILLVQRWVHGRAFRRVG